MIRELAKTAYDAYKHSAGGKSLVSGEPLPEFDQLPEPIKVAWCDAAQAVANVVVDRRKQTRRKDDKKSP